MTKVYTLIEETDGESANVYSYSTLLGAQAKLQELRDEYLDGEPSVNELSIDKPLEFCSTDGDYWVHIQEDTVG